MNYHRSVRFLLALSLCGVVFNLSIYIPPHELYLAGVASLFVPVATFVHLVLAILLFRIRSRYALFPAVMFVIGMIQVSGVYSIISSEQEHSTSDLLTSRPAAMNVLTYNVDKLRDDEFQQDKRRAFTDWVVKSKFDVICLQEMLEEKDKPFILEGYHKIFHGNVVYPGDRIGMFLFSRYPILNEGEVEFGPGSINRLIWADVPAGNKIIRVINVHLRSYDFEGYDLKPNLKKLRDGQIDRSRHTRVILEFLQNSPYPVLLCGDFNEVPYSHQYKLITSAVVDTFIRSGDGFGYTYSVKGIPIRIDYIFTSPNMNSTEYTIHHNLNWSNHCPVTLKIPL